ncbi:acyltransferase family protein [Brachybacterium ginsengisoli]|uniref:acyltransferase family protein n=1 Tax=Brachybacterium ginsengisoli TaxID=1331682 RepID=UPI00157FB042|nr:acyltransferase [Brachybacterium ginsengisoli]
MTAIDTPLPRPGAPRLDPPRAPQVRSAPPSGSPRPSAASGARDAGIDLARALCVIAVLLIHGLQVGVTVDGGQGVLEYATRGAAWYAPLTWVLQVLPLFFMIAGFAGVLAHRRSRAAGRTAAEFVAGRVHRLLVPALATIGAVGVGFLALMAAGVPGELMAEISLRYGQPLWFLGVFLAVQAMLPTMAGLHERAPLRSFAGLAAGAVAVDLLRLVTGVDAIGYANLAFVWLALQQLGFLLADGHLDRLSARWRIGIGAGAAGLLALGMLLGICSPDLIAHLNPPTTALLLVGVAQTMLLTLVRTRLRALAERPRIAALTGFVTARTMTIYLWNLPVLLVMAGASAQLALLGPIPLPEPSSILWWLSRPSWLALSLLLTLGVATVLGGIEARRPPALTTRPREARLGVVLGVAAVLLLLLAGTWPVTALGAVVLILIALRRTLATLLDRPVWRRGPAPMRLSTAI